MTRPATRPALLFCIALTTAGGAAWGQPSDAGGATPPAAADPAATAPSLRSLLREARQLLQRQLPQAAYSLLEPHTVLYSSSEEFNYLLGISALDSGRPSRAVFALERVLAHNPGHTLARAEIGRAFLALRETEAARREFEEVARAELSPEVQDTVSRYLEIVARMEQAPATRRWSAMLETQFGYDSNVNFGSSLDRWVLDDGQALTPLPSSRPQASPLFEVLGQFIYTAPINGQTEWTIGSQLSQRVNASQHNSDLGTVELSGGLARTQGLNRYSMSVQMQQLYLDDASFRRARGLLGQWQRDVDRRTQAGLYAQVFWLAFPGQPVRDARRSVVGATVARGLDDKAKSVAVTNVYAGRESSRRDVDELAFDLYGLRAALSRNVYGNWRAWAGISYEYRGYKGPDGFFGITRTDRQLEIRLGAERVLGANLTVVPQLIWTRNSSTLAPSDFRRTQAVISARYRF